MTPLSPDTIAQSHERIKPYIRHTPLLESSLLNEWLGHRIVFKAEGFQKTGAFKIRGAINTLLTLKERGKLPKEVVAFSSGNHAQGVALACRLLDVKATIIMPAFTSPIKIQGTRGYGANVILTQTRQEAEALSENYAAKGIELIPPFSRDEVIIGQGTICYEALQQNNEPDAVFATCGGGGLLSGTYLGAQLIKPSIKIYGAEPLNANDVVQSLRASRIIRLADTPNTIAEGAMTLSITERTFYYLKKLAGIYEITEEEIIYWTQWLTHLLKISVEPTSAAAMAAAAKWLGVQGEKRTVLIILSGGNISPETYLKIWQHNLLEQLPSLIQSNKKVMTA